MIFTSRPTAGGGQGHGRGGTPRTLDRGQILAERARLKRLPRSPERTLALKKCKRQLERLTHRSPWKDET